MLTDSPGLIIESPDDGDKHESSRAEEICEFCFALENDNVNATFISKLPFSCLLASQSCSIQVANYSNVPQARWRSDIRRDEDYSGCHIFVWCRHLDSQKLYERWYFQHIKLPSPWRLWMLLGLRTEIFVPKKHRILSYRLLKSSLRGQYFPPHWNILPTTRSRDCLASEASPLWLQNKTHHKKYYDLFLRMEVSIPKEKHATGGNYRVAGGTESSAREFHNELSQRQPLTHINADILW